MKRVLVLMPLLISIYSNAQVICGTADEGGVVTLTAPPGNVFVSIEFASYGTPNGSCGSFTIGSCDAANSVSICSTAFVGLNSASISATNVVFGDPCGGTFKRLYIQARYSTSLPLNLTSFTARKTGSNRVQLDWSSDNETNVSHFEIRRSTDDFSFETTASVPAEGLGMHNYSFMDTISATATSYYYQLKIVDADSKYRYSKIIHVSNVTRGIKLSVFPNPANKSITITGMKTGEIFIENMAGQTIKKMTILNDRITIDISEWNAGIYFIKCADDAVKFIKM